MQHIGFDIISDLNLKSIDDFNWDDKATSLYCIIAGNVSADLNILLKVLVRLSSIYQGVFFVPGRLEYITTMNFEARTTELALIAENIPNVCLLYQQVAVIDGVAILGTNGWENITDYPTIENIMMSSFRVEDFEYLRRSLSKLQRHLDVKKIVVVTNAVPHPDLYFKEKNVAIEIQTPLNECLSADTEHKVSNWVFGNYTKQVDTYINNVNYMNNPYTANSPYWPKRLTIMI